MIQRMHAVHTLRTRFAPRRNPCADTARLSVRGHDISHGAWHIHSAQQRQALRVPGQEVAPPRGVYWGTQLTGLVLQLVQPLSSLGDLGDVLPHNPNSVVNLGLNGRRLRVSRGTSRVGRRAATGQVGVVRLGPIGTSCKRRGGQSASSERGTASDREYH